MALSPEARQLRRYRGRPRRQTGQQIGSISAGYRRVTKAADVECDRDAGYRGASRVYGPSADLTGQACVSHHGNVARRASGDSADNPAAHAPAWPVVAASTSGPEAHAVPFRTDCL